MEHGSKGKNWEVGKVFLGKKERPLGKFPRVLGKRGSAFIL
jgi:hypothetical protein